MLTWIVHAMALPPLPFIPSPSRPSSFILFSSLLFLIMIFESYFSISLLLVYIRMIHTLHYHTALQSIALHPCKSSDTQQLVINHHMNTLIQFSLI